MMKGGISVREITASKGYISDEGVLSTEYCSEIDTTICNVAEITLNNIANTATTYHRQSYFLKDNISIEDVADGSIAVYAWDARDWRSDENNDITDWQNNRARECRGTNDVQFQVSNTQTLSIFIILVILKDMVRQTVQPTIQRYYFPTLNIATIYDREVDDNSIQANYYIPDVVRTGVTSNLPFDFIKNQVNIDPSALIQDLAALPRFPKDIDQIRE